MRNKICIVVVLLFTSALFLFPGEKGAGGNKIRYTAGLSFSYNQADVTMGEDKVNNVLIYPYLAIEFGVTFSDYLELGVVAGYNRYQFDGPVDFVNLPLSLRIDNKKLNAVVLGLRAKFDLYSKKKFTLSAGGGFLYFKSSAEEMGIDLPIVSGTAGVNNYFYQVESELSVFYHCFPGFTIFAGPRLNHINGEFKVSEKIGALEGEETLTYRQKGLFGLAAGLDLEVGGHFDFALKLCLFSRMSLSIGIFYVF